MKYELTEHAQDVLAEREIQTAWLERTLDHPERVESDRSDPELEHRLLRIKEYGNRVLRVIVNKNRSRVRVVTAYFDRGVRKLL